MDGTELSYSLARQVSNALAKAGRIATPVVLDLFRAGEQGCWYDPSDLSTLYQDAAGTTPVTAMEQPVGLMLDKRLGLVRGVELLVDGEFANGLSSWGKSGEDATHILTASGGTLRYQSDTTTPVLNISQAGIGTVGKVYEITVVVSSYVSGSLKSDAMGGAVIASKAGVNRCIATCTSTTFNCLRNTANVDMTLDSISVRELPGNHASQSTAAARPVLSARKNLAIKTEDFGDAAWTKFTGLVATGKQITFTNNNSYTQLNVTGVAPAGATLTMSFLASIASGTQQMRAYLADGADGNPSYNTLVNLTTTPTRFTLTATFDVNASGNLAIQLHGASLIAPGTVVTISELQVETGPAATRYQRVNTATDYDTSGFPVYLKGDGVDDFYNLPIMLEDNTPNFMVAAFHADAGVTATDQTVFAFRNTSNQTAIPAQLDVVAGGAGTLRYVVRGDNTAAAIPAFGAVRGKTVVGGGVWDGGAAHVFIDSVLAGSAVESADIGAITVPNRGTLLAGGAGATPAVFLKGNFYGGVIRKGAISAAQRQSVERFLATKAGVTL